jgi:hypothetical protein
VERVEQALQEIRQRPAGRPEEDDPVRPRIRFGGMRDSAEQGRLAEAAPRVELHRLRATGREGDRGLVAPIDKGAHRRRQDQDRRCAPCHPRRLGRHVDIDDRAGPDIADLNDVVAVRDLALRDIALDAQPEHRRVADH